MKNIYYSLMIGASFLFCQCNNTSNKAQNSQKADMQQVSGDSSAKATGHLELADSTVSTDTTPNQNSPNKTAKSVKYAGKHPITLQWISWDQPGSALVKPLDDIWYSIKGSQKNKEGDYLQIDGKIRRLDQKTLEFEGTIITKVNYNNNGQACVKEGKQIFYGKGSRSYYRLQNMGNCEENNVVDYVDIYPGKSSL